MPVTYEWVVVDLQVAVQHDGLDDVVKAVNWRFQCSDGMCTSEVHGLTEVDPPDPQNYIPFNQLTSQEVIDWVIAKLGPEAIAGFEAYTEAQATTHHNMAIVTKTLPS